MKIPTYSTYSQILIGTFFLVAPLMSNMDSVLAETIVIEDKKAQQSPTLTGVVPGKASPIVFKNDEVINFILLSDQSKNIYTSNAPIESGKAGALYIRQIQHLDIPGTTTSDYPNLFVETVDAQGNKNEYEFVLNNNSGDRDRITIKKAEPAPEPEPIPEPEP